jgi:hypothetical protein
VIPNAERGTVTADLQPLAAAIGEAWANEVVHSLRSDDREVIGAWPGTMNEARMRVRVVLQMRLDAQKLEQLARIANSAARRGWQEVSQADPEP